MSGNGFRTAGNQFHIAEKHFRRFLNPYFKSASICVQIHLICAKWVLPTKRPVEMHPYLETGNGV
jgi:hypothetical protein